MQSQRERWTGVAGGLSGFAILAAFILIAVVALLQTGARAGFSDVVSDPVILPALRFTLLQAGLSTLLSVLFAIPVARALARQRRFPGRIWLIRLMAVPMGLPVLIGALGLLGIWGRSGFINDMLLGLGASQPFSIYGLSGILLAHVFFNMPLMVRLLLASLERVPGEYWLMSAELGMSPASIFRFIEWPAIRDVLPAAAGLVFMLCATSFTLVLVLGGGPAATTLEVAIYQALRFDFDPGRAVSLAMLQIGITAIILGAMSLLARPAETAHSTGRPTIRFDARTSWARAEDGICVLLAALFLGLPLAAIVVSGLKADLLRLILEPAFHAAALTSLVIASCAAVISLVVALLLITGAIAAQRRGAGLLARGFRALMLGTGSLVLLVPSIVLATGWFLVLRPFGEIARFAPAVVIGINAMMALPFVVGVLRPAIENHIRITGRLRASLGISGWSRLRLIDLPVLVRPLLMALSFAMALSLGDLGAVALFGAENLTTLPWLVYSRLGSYRTADADGLALILGFICLTLTMIGTAGRQTYREDLRNG